MRGLEVCCGYIADELVHLSEFSTGVDVALQRVRPPA